MTTEKKGQKNSFLFYLYKVFTTPLVMKIGGGGDQGFLGTGSFLCSHSSDATKYNLGVQVRLVSLPAT